MGSYGGMGGMGGYGGYGGYGGMGYGGMGYGGMPPYGAPGADPSLSQRMEAGTAATFQMLQAIVGAFGGFAQMLESTFMATHSSFFAMIGVAEQFGQLRNYLGQVLSIFALIRWLKSLVKRLFGIEDKINTAEFKAFEKTSQAAAQQAAEGKAKMSKRPLIVFFLTVIGIPYLMNRLVKMITARQALTAAPMGQIDPNSLTFLRAAFDYAPANAQELELKKDDIVAILTPENERQNPGWWMGRMRDGRMGFIPSTHLAELPRKKVEDAPPTHDIELPQSQTPTKKVV